MRSAPALLKRAEFHLLRDVSLWTEDPRSWRESQELLNRIRLSNFRRRKQRERFLGKHEEAEANRVR